MIIPAAEAVVHPRTMMITLRHAMTAEITMFRSGRLHEVAGPTCLRRSKKNMIERVMSHLFFVIRRGDVMGCAGYAEICEHIRKSQKNRKGKEKSSR